MRTYFAPGRGLITVPAAARVGTGAWRFRAALDTGSQRTLISERLRDTVGVGSERVLYRSSIMAVGGLLPVDAVRLDWMGAAGVERTAPTVLVYPLAAGLGFECLLGLDFLAGHEVCVNLVAGYVDIHPA